ncbi:MAG: hypothetical protein PSX81_13490 [bacterium]|nr:hypothetical protein [bacterium]
MNTNKAKAILLILICLLYGYLFFSVFLANGYVPYHEDETINYDSGRLFYETNSFQAPFCVSENVSPIFSSNWYGFFYNFFYGLINKIVGLHTRNIILVNIVLFLLCFIFIKWLKLSPENKKSIYLVLLLIPNVVYFLFGFWPVIINLFLAIVLIRLLFHINEMSINGLNYSRYMSLYFLLCFSFILINPLWAIWTFGLLPYYKNRRDSIVKASITAFIMLCSFMYIKLFCASWITGTTSIMFYYLFDFQFLNFIHLIKTNLLENIHYFYFQNIEFIINGQYDNVINQIILVTLLLISPVYYFYNKNKIFIAFSIISVLVFFILFTIYTPEFEYFQRILTPVYFLLLFGLIISDFFKIKAIVLGMIIISFPISLINSISNIEQRKMLYTKSENEYKHFINDLRNLGEYMDSEEQSIVQWAYFEFNMPRSLFFMNLSFTDKRNRPIIYTTRINCFSENECDVVDPKIKFMRYGKLRVNYALSKKEINMQGYQLIVSKKYFNLYKIL